MKILMRLAVLCTLIMSTGCVTRLGSLSIVSTKNMDVSKPHRVDTKVRNVGRDVTYIYICFPIGNPSVKEAMDDAIEQTPGAVGISDVTIKKGNWWIPLIYGEMYFEVEGNPIFQATEATPEKKK